MQSLSAWLLALVGFAVGAAAGFSVRHARLCSFGAIEDAWMGGDTRRLRIFGLALGLAMLGTQALVIAGLLDPALTTYTPTAVPLVAILIGSTMFGIGMAMVGTCGFGSLVRLGTGDLRSLVVVLVLGATAFAMLRGVFSDFRITALESLSVAMPESTRADLASVAQHVVGHRPARRHRGASAASACVCWRSATDGCGARRVCCWPELRSASSPSPAGSRPP